MTLTTNVRVIYFLTLFNIYINNQHMDNMDSTDNKNNMDNTDMVDNMDNTVD